MNDSPLVILTALDLEYMAVRKRLTRLEVHWHRAGTRFEVGRLADSGYRVALGLAGKGNQPTAVLAERAMAEFGPAALLFVGVAGALWPSVALGDVVVATHVYAYHGGTSEDDGLKARPRVWEIAHEPDQIARHLARTDEWTRRLPSGEKAPKVHFGPIAAGEIVQDSAISDHARWVRQTYNDALAIEMEAAGVAQAGHLNRSLPVMVVRGISDLADGTKAATDCAHWQPRAAANAATFAIALAEELVRNRQDGRPTNMTGKARGAAMSETVRNIAKGNARVGVQAGQIYGNVWIGTGSDAPPSLAAQIADFQTRLRRARMAGELDESTYAAAEEQLTVVTESLTTGAVQDKNTLMVAFKKLRGLISDVADLATKLTAIITIVRGIS
jgi:adenosylhomocysteine nucleosidase